MILITISIALIAFIGYGLFNANQLKSIQIIKSITIKGSKKDVFEMVKYLNNFPKWSPFLADDPQQKYEIKGQDGIVGAQYHWNGNKGKDIGFQEIKNIAEGQSISMQCYISKPFVAEPSFDYYFKETENGIEVNQDFKLSSSLIDAFFMWLFGAKAQMEKTNQRGLELLKQAIEK